MKFQIEFVEAMALAAAFILLVIVEMKRDRTKFVTNLGRSLYIQDAFSAFFVCSGLIFVGIQRKFEHAFSPYISARSLEAGMAACLLFAISILISVSATHRLNQYLMLRRPGRGIEMHSLRSLRLDVLRTRKE